jgi:ribonuclease E
MFPPPPRSRSFGLRGGSIEDDLEADLAAAEIGHVGPSFEEDFEESLEPGLDDLPPPREPVGRPRGEEGRRRDDEGRGRREGRGRGRRDDRRGNGRRPMGGRPGMGRPKPLIQDIFRRGQEVLVQVIKEGIGTKGPTLSTYISIAGRYLVLMPGLNRVGVSRKIADDEQRRRLRDIFNELKPPRGLGFIIRTAGIDKNKKELQRDLAYLSRLWQVVVRRIRKMKAPAEIYQESDMITRTIRDTFTHDIETIWVDEPAAFQQAQEFLQIVMPRYAPRIKLYDGKEPLFHKYGIEDEIARIQQKKVPLPMGGSIVIEQTEALVAIDVNSGNFRADNNAEETAYQMNLQAAREIARQLRLRDLGGVIVNDFIDMRDEKHRRGVEKAMRDAVKRDRARTKVLKISAFGIIEMTRQRIRPSLKRSVYTDCPACHGMGQVKTVESMSIEVMRMLQLASHREQVHHVEVRVTEEVANYLQNKKRREISRLEESGNIQVLVRGTPGAPPETLEFLCLDNNNNEVKLLPAEPVSRPQR